MTLTKKLQNTIEAVGESAQFKKIQKEVKVTTRAIAYGKTEEKKVEAIQEVLFNMNSFTPQTVVDHMNEAIHLYEVFERRGY